MKKHRPHSPYDPQAGLSLISLAAILIVVGVILTSLVDKIKVSGERDMIQESHRMLRTARQEMVGFSAERCRLLSDNATDPLYYLNIVGHRLGRFRSDVFYEPAPQLEGLTGADFGTFNGTSTDLTLVTPTRTVHNLAFIIWSTGENHQDDLMRIEAASVVTYTQPPYEERVNDDIVDFVTFTELQNDHLANCGSP